MTKLKYQSIDSSFITNKNGNTPLMIAICKGMEDVALKILENPDQCNLNQIDKNGGTALMFAINRNMEKVALKILENPDQCNLNYVSKNGNTVFDSNHYNHNFNSLEHFSTINYKKIEISVWEVCIKNRT